ncbi:MAG: transaldolase family protein [Chloroflexota bacterium]
MRSGYFHRVARETATRFWINNPTGVETDLAISAGAISCTTNPTYCARLLDEEPTFMDQVFRSVLSEKDDGLLAERVYQEASRRIVERFRPLYESSRGLEGFVTIQGDPRRDDDPQYIVDEALRHRRVGDNVMAKIPAHEAGIAAIAELVAEDVPICATEIFSVSQAAQVCETYRQAASKSRRHPPFFVTHITGIFDKYMAEYVKREGIAISPSVLSQAGWAVAHEQYAICQERGYPGILLGGGALAPLHFTEMVGGQTHVTLNWSIAKSLIEADGPVVRRISMPAPDNVVEELLDKLPDFHKAFCAGALPAEEFKDFGPLVLFRNMFLDGYSRLAAEVETQRSLRRQSDSIKRELRLV